jgi:hypothetical protein
MSKAVWVWIDPLEHDDECKVGFVGFAELENADGLEMEVARVLSTVHGVTDIAINVLDGKVIFDVEDVVDLTGFVKTLPRDPLEVVRSWPNKYYFELTDYVRKSLHTAYLVNETLKKAFVDFDVFTHFDVTSEFWFYNVMRCFVNNLSG